ncbi:MAG: Ig-like domain-containing protein [Oscillospiraceae bacterium]|nr:Ig-like domain-containing protein [Oscillospiraceae bacterium]
MKHKALKRVICTLLTAVLLTMICPLNAFAASLKLNYSSVSVTKGFYVTLKSNYTGSGKVTWSTSDKTVATVSSSGKVYAKKAGSCYITAKAGGSSVRCKVKVVNGKLTLSQSSVTVDEGSSELISVTAKGSHSLKLVQGDKTIAKGSWVSPWKGDKIGLNIIGVSEGSTRIKVQMSKYTEIYKYVTVNVNAVEQEIEEQEGKTSTILVDMTTASVGKGKTTDINIYSDNTSKVTVTSSDTSVATVSTPKWGTNGYGTVTITGVKNGTATITVSASDNTNLKKTVKVTVSSDGYYEVSDTAPIKKLVSDTILQWTDGTSTKYMLVPAGYDSAHANSVFAKETGKAQYYAVYEESPVKVASNDVISSFKVTISGQSVTRFVLLPAGYDTVRYNTVTSQYTGKYNYWIIYNASPVPQSTTDVVKTWQASVDGILYTRYILLPAGYSESRLNQIIADDTAANNLYYAVSETEPKKSATSDTVYKFTVGTKTLYILLPANYDPARRDTAVAKYTGSYSYYVVYTEKPEGSMSTDVVKSWKKVIDGKAETRYMLLPAGYNEDFYNSLVNDDVNSTGSYYYTVTSTLPTKTQDSDEIIRWYNARQGVYKYMLVPQNYDTLKKNNTMYADTGVYEYYKVYSTDPTSKKLSETDQVIEFKDETYGTVYILVPKDYEQSKLNDAINELSHK